MRLLEDTGTFEGASSLLQPSAGGELLVAAGLGRSASTLLAEAPVKPWALLYMRTL